MSFIIARRILFLGQEYFFLGSKIFSSYFKKKKKIMSSKDFFLLKLVEKILGPNKKFFFQE